MQANPFGIENMWAQGDFVMKAVAILLVAMSIASWYVIITKSIQLWRFRRSAHVAGHDFWDAANLNEGIALLGTNNPFATLAHASASAVRHHNAHKGHLHDQLSLSDWVTLSLRQTIDEISGKLQSGMAILASVSSSAPFVGLFGTVWGIYHALVAIGISGQAGIEKVAGPVGEALVMTALGLAVAIPAAFGYNALVRSNKALMAKMNKFGFDLHALCVTGARAELANGPASGLRLAANGGA